jgi:hypothetical protein
MKVYVSIDIRDEFLFSPDSQLGEIIGKDDIAMNYQNYNTAIITRYKVQLVGWPPYIPFTNPSNLKTEHLQRLIDALNSTECKWRVMSGDEIRAHNAQYDSAMASGQVVNKPRKERSDKNKKRSGENAGAPSAKKQKVARKNGSNLTRQVPPQALSREFISDSDD